MRSRRLCTAAADASPLPIGPSSWSGACRRSAVLDALAAAFTAYDIDAVAALFLEDAVSDIVGMVYEVGRDSARSGSLDHTFVVEDERRYRAGVVRLDDESFVVLWVAGLMNRTPSKRSRTSSVSTPWTARSPACAGTSSVRKRSWKSLTGSGCRPIRSVITFDRSSGWQDRAVHGGSSSPPEQVHRVSRRQVLAGAAPLGGGALLGTRGADARAAV